MEKNRYTDREPSDDSKEAETAMYSDVQGAIAARAIESASSSYDPSGECLDKPQPLLALDPEFEPALHSDGRVEAKLSDGRLLDIMTRSFGRRGGYPIIFCPGMPASGMADLPYRYVQELCLGGLELVTFDRPGYGDSTRWKGHRVGDGAVLVQAVARAYGFDHYSTAGRSGGAPYALGAAALCPGVVNAAVFGCRTPPNADIDRLNGASLVNEMLIGAADEETLVESFRSTSGQAIIDNPLAVVRTIIPNLGPSDRRVTLEPEVNRYLAASHKNALKKGSAGRIDNIFALRSPWCFELSDLGDKLTYLIQGAADDQFTTPEHFIYLSDNIPNCRPIKRLDMGHMGTMALELKCFRALARDAFSKGY